MELTPDYTHSTLFHSFGSDDSKLPQAFFSFKIEEEINFMEHAFGISVLQ